MKMSLKAILTLKMMRWTRIFKTNQMKIDFDMAEKLFIDFRDKFWLNKIIFYLGI